MLPSTIVAPQNGVSLLGKLMSVRHYSTRGGSRGVGGACKLQLRLVDGSGNSSSSSSSMQVVMSRRAVRNMDCDALFGKWVVLHGMDVRPSNPTFDSSSALFCAYDTASTNWAAIFPSSSSTVRYVDTITRFGADRPDLMYVPHLTAMADLKVDTCVNTAVVSVSPVKVHPISGDISVFVKDSVSTDATVSELVVPSADANSVSDVFVMDGAALKEAAVGSVLVLLDFRCVVEFVDSDSDGTYGTEIYANGESGAKRVRMVILRLRSWGPSRIKVGTRSVELAASLKAVVDAYSVPLLDDDAHTKEAEAESDTAIAITTAAMNASGARRILPSVAAILDESNNTNNNNKRASDDKVTVFGVIVAMRSSQNYGNGGGGFVRSRCEADFMHVIDVDEADHDTDGSDMMLSCAVCGEGAKVTTAYTLSACFREAPDVELRLSTGTCSALLGGMSALEFGRMDEKAQGAELEALTGKAVVLRVWCKNDKNKQATSLLALDGAVVIGESDGYSYHDGDHRNATGAETDKKARLDNAVLMPF